MNSYPVELLAQLAPLMFVAGLDTPAVSPPPAGVSPSLVDADGTPTSPPASTRTSSTPIRTAPPDPFVVLAQRLREAFSAQRKLAIYSPPNTSSNNKAFTTVLVDAHVRFPPRKLAPQDDPSHPSTHAHAHHVPPHALHSPLSPLTTSSPLFPDGLIAPIWVRKHTSLVPAVFVLFLRLWEAPMSGGGGGWRSPLEGVDGDREREAEEKRRDGELAGVVAARKKSTAERGIKLTVVLMATRRMLDDPALDARLMYIRRQSGLDTRAALFVLSPVSPGELADFVRSLQQALYEPALEYYTAHSKRVRRKRNRHAQSSSSSSALSTASNLTLPSTTSIGGGLSHGVGAAAGGGGGGGGVGGGGATLGLPHIAARPLRPEGWTVRYEYKMACFAEFRGEGEVALKHYQDAYATLLTMFGSTAILPPRTKRWAEAKVLADCISIKITKLYLYNNEHALALGQHTSHLRRFADLSRGWGIGEETFEYWSWVARQHRILAELLEQGLRSTLVLPSHAPINLPAPTNTITNNTTTNVGVGTVGLGTGISVGGMEADGVLGFGGGGLPLTPGGLPLTPGAPTTTTTTTTTTSGISTAGAGVAGAAFGGGGMNPSHALQHPGYYYYMAARCTEMRRGRYLGAVEAETTQRTPVLSPGFANEKKVDHLTIILELYTKSYELFKKYSPLNAQKQTQGRLTLWIAFRIAQTYYEAGKFDMGVRFFERIAKTYRREKWGHILRPLLSTWYACAQRIGDVDLSVRLVVEMMGHGLSEGEDPGMLQEDLLAVLKSTVPSSPNPLHIDLAESQPIFTSTGTFYTPEVQIDEPAAFQLALSAPEDVIIDSLPIVQMVIHFSGVEGVGQEICVKHKERGTGQGENGGKGEKAGVGNVRLVELGDILEGGDRSRSASLRWGRGETVIFAGTVSADTPKSIKITKVVMTLEEGAWKIEIPFDVGLGGGTVSHARLTDSAPGAGVGGWKWLSGVDPVRFLRLERVDCSSVVVKYRSHNVLISLEHHAPAMLDEDYHITLEITNADDRELEIVVDVLLQPTEIDHAVNQIILDEERSSGLIKGVQLGALAPGVSVLKTLHLVSAGAAGDRTMDISIQSSVPSPFIQPFSDELSSLGDSATSTTAAPTTEDICETLRTLVVPTVAPLKVKHDVVYSLSLVEMPGLADLKTFEHGMGEGGDLGEYVNKERAGERVIVVNTTFEIGGPWGLDVETMKVIRLEDDYARIVCCDLEDEEEDYYPAECLPGDEFCYHSRIALASDRGGEDGTRSIPGPGVYEIVWRRILPNGERGPRSTTRFALPEIRPPSEGLHAFVDIPAKGRLHVPLDMHLTIRNCHPARSANITVQLESDLVEDAFRVSGLRSGRVPIMLPGSEEKLTWKLIPVECGYVRVPTIRVVDRRRAIASAQGASGPVDTQGELVKVVDVRWEKRADDDDHEGEESSRDSEDVQDAYGGPPTMLILP